MAVIKKKLNDSYNDWAIITYPSADVFLRERNYIILEGLVDTYIIKTIKIGDKTLDFGYYDLYSSGPIHIEASAYYKKYNGKFSIVITFYSDYESEYDQSTNISVNSTCFDCYNPFMEAIATQCKETGYAQIVPPTRMIRNGSKNVISMFVAKRQPERVIFAYRWNINGTDDGSTLIRKNVVINSGGFVARYIENMNTSNLNIDTVLSTIIRRAEILDNTRDVVYVTWRTRWGLDVSHVFYLGEYATDKADAKEIESTYYYEEHSKHIRKGTFYIDNISNPYDIWYYQTLENSELVTMFCDRWDNLPATYMPNGNNTFAAVKITGSDIKNAIVGGVCQSTITFYWEMNV